MEIEPGIGLGLYVSGLVLMVRSLEDKFAREKKKRGAARISSIVTLIVLGVLFMTYGT